MFFSTANLSYSSFWRNREYRYWTHDPGVITYMSDLYEDDISGVPLELENIHPNILICPENCRSKIEELLLSARDSIWIQTQYITDSRILSLLAQKYAEGVDIRILVSKYQSVDLTPYV